MKQLHQHKRASEWMIEAKNGQIRQLSRGWRKKPEKIKKSRKQGKYWNGNGTGVSSEILRENEEL